MVASHPKTEEILLLLKKDGHRMTQTRRQVIDHLVRESRPIAAQEILSYLKKKGKVVNKTTVYRELLFLKDVKVIHEIDLLEGQKRYELHDPESHHHHLVCRTCESIECIEMPNDLDVIEDKIQKKHKFKITGHVLEFFGTCRRCSC